MNWRFFLQIGKMESDEEQSVMTVRTKKRVVKIRQPSNIYFRLKEIPGLPKQLSWEGESSVISSHKIAPHTNIVGQELLEWCLNVFRRNYDAKFMTNRVNYAKLYNTIFVFRYMHTIYVLLAF